jgi:hypothetical protein
MPAQTITWNVDDSQDKPSSKLKVSISKAKPRCARTQQPINMA